MSSTRGHADVRSATRMVQGKETSIWEILIDGFAQAAFWRQDIARHMVACWNAAREHRTEDMEQNGMEMISYRAKALALYGKLQPDPEGAADSLVEVAEFVAGDDENCWQQIARAALAKAGRS